MTRHTQSLLAIALAILPNFIDATRITDIQGSAFQSPLTGQTVHKVTGVVVAKVRPLLLFALYQGKLKNHKG